jgi:negative regulator of replication initiation
MKMHTIEIDDEVLGYLKKNAEPLEDTHNSVLRKLLLGNGIRKVGPQAEEEIPNIPDGVPKALSQILEVIYFVKKRGYARTEATNKVAMLRNTAPQTVIDKYCRQLNKKTFEIDRLLQDDNLNEFQSILERKFISHIGVIRDFFSSLTSQPMLEASKTQLMPKVVPAINTSLTDNYINKKIRNFILFGKNYAPRYWKELLVTVSNEMYHRHSSDFDKCLNLRGSKMRYFSTRANELSHPVQIANSQYFVETKLNSNSIVKRSRDLMALFGYKENDLKVVAE